MDYVCILIVTDNNSEIITAETVINEKIVVIIVLCW